MLDSDPENRQRWLPFAQWWATPLLAPNEGGTLSRRCDFVLLAANKEGGARVDPFLPEAWIDLRDGTWKGASVTTAPDGSLVPIAGLVPAIVRQIAHEVLTTLSASELVPEVGVTPQAVPGVIVGRAEVELPVGDADR